MAKSRRIHPAVAAAVTALLAFIPAVALRRPEPSRLRQIQWRLDRAHLDAGEARGLGSRKAQLEEKMGLAVEGGRPIAVPNEHDLKRLSEQEVEEYARVASAFNRKRLEAARGYNDAIREALRQFEIRPEWAATFAASERSAQFGRPVHWPPRYSDRPEEGESAEAFRMRPSGIRPDGTIFLRPEALEEPGSLGFYLHHEKLHADLIVEGGDVDLRNEMEVELQVRRAALPAVESVFGLGEKEWIAYVLDMAGYQWLASEWEFLMTRSGLDPNNPEDRVRFPSRPDPDLGWVRAARRKQVPAALLRRIYWTDPNEPLKSLERAFPAGAMSEPVPQLLEFSRLLPTSDPRAGILRWQTEAEQRRKRWQEELRRRREQAERTWLVIRNAADLACSDPEEFAGWARRESFAGANIDRIDFALRAVLRREIDDLKPCARHILAMTQAAPGPASRRDFLRWAAEYRDAHPLVPTRVLGALGRFLKSLESLGAGRPAGSSDARSEPERERGGSVGRPSETERILRGIRSDGRWE